MTTLLVVHHSPTPTVRALTDAVVAGTHDDEIEGVTVVVRPALEAGGALSDDGSAAGLGGGKKPFGLWVHGRYDTTGAVRSVVSIVQALPWSQAAETLEVIGDVTEEHTAAAYELGGTLAALLVP